jgi:hypothetical protein
MTTKTKPLTRDDLEALYDHDEWGGYGYLGEREYATRTEAGRKQAEAADALILDYANSHGWTREVLFRWVDSKNGRWLGEEFFRMGHSAAEATANATKWQLLA